MLFELTSRFIPNPKPLQDAIDAGLVGVTIDVRGTAYTVSKDCKNPEIIFRAIEQRKNWVILAAKAQGALIGLAILGALILVSRQSNFLS